MTQDWADTPITWGSLISVLFMGSVGYAGVVLLSMLASIAFEKIDAAIYRRKMKNR